MGENTKRRMSLSSSSSHLHPPPQVSIPTGSIAPTPRVSRAHQSRKTQAYVATPLPLPHLPHPPPFRAAGTPSSSLESILPRVPPARPVARNHPAMEVKCAAAAVSWSLAPASRATTATRFGLVLIFIVRAEGYVVLFGIVRAITLRMGNRTRAAPIVFRQRTCGSQFSRPPQRSCLVGSAKIVSDVHDSTCLAVRRRAESGWRRARMKFLSAMYGMSTSHGLGLKVSPKIGKAHYKGEGQHT